MGAGHWRGDVAVGVRRRDPGACREEAAAKLTPGLYELTSEVTALSSTDNTTPPTTLKLGDKA